MKDLSSKQIPRETPVPKPDGRNGNRQSFFSSAEIRELSAKSDLWGGLLVMHCYAVIGASIAVYALWPGVVTFLIAVMLIGSRQLGLAILMHDAAHGALFRNRFLNNFIGEWFCGRPILADLPEYRRYHLQHHKYTQTDKDPDLVLSKPFPTTRVSLARKFLRDLSGMTGIKQRLAQIMFHFRMAGDTGQGASQSLSQALNGPELVRAFYANLALFAVLWAVGEWWWWLACWALPLLTWFQLVLRIRNIAEHGVVEFSDNPLRNVRTTRAGFLMRLLVAPYWVNYHLEHHLVMHVPCRNLPRMHRMMLEKGYGPAMKLGRSYFSVLLEASSRSQPVAN